MYFSYKGWHVTTTSEYLKEFRNGNFWPVYDLELQKKLLLELPNYINERDNADKYAYAYALYKHGNRFDQDKAFYLTEQLLDCDYLPAYYLYGLMFYEGVCVTKSYASAFKWFDRGAQKGLAICEYNLGIMYIEGNGVLKDEAKGMQFIERSADSGFNKALYFIGYNYYKGKYQYPVDYLTAFNYFDRGVRQADPACCLAMYDMYANGNGVQKDKSKAVKYLSYSAMYGNMYSNYRMGLINLLGEEVEKNIDAAYRYFTVAADGDVAEACYYAGALILGGDVFWVDKSVGKEYIKKGAKLGSENAKKLLKSI